MQLLYDLLPVIAFFVAYKIAGIYVATGVLIVAVLVQVAVSWLRHRKVSPMLLISAALVLLFGGLTLAIQDPTFIKWKPTVLYWLFAVVIGASHLMRGPSILQRMMGEGLQLDDRGWKQLSAMWVVFCVVAGAANIYVAYNFAEPTWVDFKLFGLTALMFVFVMLQAVWLSRKIEQK
jgi:intracellular septation protein